MLPVASLRPVQNRLAENWMTCWASFADGLRLLLQFVPCFLCCVQFVPLCQQPQLQAELPSELPTYFSISTSISWCSFFGFLRFNRPGFCSDLSHPSTHRPFCACCTSRNRFFNSAAFHSSTSISFFDLNLVFSWLSRQPSILALLQCVDDFQYPCFSSSVQLLSSRRCSPRTFQPAMGYALDCLLLAVLLTAFCWLCSFASSHVFVTLLS